MKVNAVMHRALLGITGFLLACSSTAGDLTTKSGIYTEAQAAKGQSIYDQKCKTCHLTPQYYEEKLRVWDGQPLVDLFDSVTATMPGDNPGGLAWEDYSNVLAYIFSALGYPAGEQELNPDDGSMDGITIDTIK